MLVFFKAAFFVLHSPYYTLMNFLTMLCVLVPSMLLIVLSTLKCPQASDLWQQLHRSTKNVFWCRVRNVLTGFK